MCCVVLLGLAGAGPIKFEVLLRTLGNRGYRSYRLCDGKLSEFQEKRCPRSIPIRIEVGASTTSGLGLGGSSNVRNLKVNVLDFWKEGYEGFRKSLALRGKQTVETTGACYTCGRMQWL